MGNNKLLLDESPLFVLPTLARAVGLQEAIFLQQLHFWLRVSRNEFDGRTWVYNTLDQWRQQFPFWTKDTLFRLVKNLREQGVLVASDEYNARADVKTLWYSIDYDKLDAILAALPEEPVAKTRQAYRENATGPIAKTRNDHVAKTRQAYRENAKSYKEQERSFQERENSVDIPAADEAKSATETAVANQPVPEEARKQWQKALGELQLQLAPSTYSTWLHDTWVNACEDDQWVIGTANSYARDWLQHRLRAMVKRTLKHVVGRTVEVNFVTAERPHRGEG